MSEQTAYVKEPVDLSIIIVNWNTCNLLAKCLDSIFQTVWASAYEIIVVDNNSTDGSVDMVYTQFPAVKLIENQQNVGFARANNQAMALSRGRYALLLNSDALLLANAVQAMLDLAEAMPQAGIIGVHLLNADGSFQASHTPFPDLWQEILILSGIGRMLYGRWYPSRGPDDDKGPQVVDYVEGACMLVRREAFEDVGGLDEGYFMYAEEVDWCYAMRAKGWQVWYQPAAKVIRFFRKHYGDRAARLLKLQIYGLATIKIVVHGLLRLVSAGRYGRPVVPLRYLAMELKEV
jgi:GT2 family glycosyltransferase